MKTAVDQQLGIREPRQARSRYKVELMLEATMRLLERRGIEALTTNAVAAEAGVSIGTLYQFFPNKEALLDTLAERELRGTSERVMRAMTGMDVASTQERITAVVDAVAAGYSGRHGAHRLVMDHSLSRGGNRLAPLLSALTDYLSTDRDIGPIRRALGEADAFVLTHAFAGALRAMISEEHAPDRQALSRSLTRLVLAFFD